MGEHSGMPLSPKKCPLLPLPSQEGMTTGEGSITKDIDSRPGAGPHGQGDRRDGFLPKILLPVGSSQ